MAEAIEVAPTELQSIDGWLLLPLLQLIASPLFNIVNAIKEGMKGFPQPSPGVLRGELVYGMAAGVPFLLTFLAFVFGLYCLWQFLERKRRTPKLMIAWYVLNMLTALSMAAYLQLAPKNLSELIQQQEPAGYGLGRLAFLVVLNAILIGYFVRSRRVQNTFVR